jgi:fatty acid desaturase
VSSSSSFATPAGCTALRQALRKSMPEEAFQPVPMRGVAALLQVPVYVGLAALIVVGPLPFWVDLLIALVIGQMVTSVGLIAHDTLHRSTFRSKFWQQVVGWVAFPWYLFGPGVWLAWHVQAHHGNTQDGAADPDRLVDLERYRTSAMARWIHVVTPGSGTLLSYVSPVFLFTLQGQLFLWYYSGLPEHAKVTIDRRREKAITVAITLGWLALAAALGPWDAFCVILIPMLTSNATLMTYISTNHWLRPRTPDGNNPFTNTTSVIVPAFVDWIHVEFSYHQEHHVFPQMSPKYAALLRTRMRELAPDAVAAYPLVPVIRELYATPALYLDDDTLVHPDGSGATRIEEVTERLERRIVGSTGTLGVPG